jgi:hypothetical protein
LSRWYQSIERTETNTLVHFTDGFGRAQVLTYAPAKSCTCGLSTQPCLHQRLFVQPSETNADGSESTNTQTDNNESATSDPNDLSKTARRADRIVKLARAMDELDLWLEDILSRGLAAHVQESAQFAAGIATRMADASLGTLQRRLLDLEAETLRCIRSNQPIPSAWADLLMIYQAGRNQDRLPQPLWDELTQTLGINLRKDDVKAANLTLKDHWTVVCIEQIQVEPRLKQRNTWLYAHQNKSYHTIIEFEFENVTHLSSALPIGYTFLVQAWAYPGALQSRLLFDEIPEKGLHMVVNYPICADLSAALKVFGAQVRKLPWSFAAPVMIADLRFRYLTATKKWVAIDCTNHSLPLLFSDDMEAEKLLAQTLAGVVGCFCLVQAGGVRVLRVTT